MLHPEADRTKEVNPRGKYVLRLYDGAKEGDANLLESLGVVLVALNWGNKSLNHGLVV